MNRPRLLGMSLLLLVCVAAGHLALAPPDASASLRLPGTSHDIELEWRQVSPDLSSYRPSSSHDLAVRQKQLQALLAFDGELSVDVPFKVGEQRFAPGRYRMAFTADHDDSLRWFLVDGQNAVPLRFKVLEPGFSTANLAMQLVFVTRSQVQLIWHLGERGGRADLFLGKAKTRRR